MNFKKTNKALATSIVLGALAFMGQAQAAGTGAGFVISNTANLNFSIGAVAQNPIASNTVSFVVDNKVNFLLVEDQGGTGVIVTPGATAQIMKFKLTNTGNSTQDFTFTTANLASGTTLFGNTDSFDVSSCQVFVDSAANNGTYESAVDTQPYVDELAPDASKAIFVRCTIPSTVVNNDFSVSNLIASVATGGTPGTQGAPLAQTTGANTNGIDVVFADAAGTDDSARDGKVSARAAYLVRSATLSIVKSNAPICDPVNFNSNPKNIPGAYVRYTIDITNAAGAGASAVLGNITDTIQSANLTFDANLGAPTATKCDTPENGLDYAFKLTCSGVGNGRACATAPRYQTGTADADGFNYNTGIITGNMTTALQAEGSYAAGEIKAGETVRIEFNAIVK